MLSKGLKDYIRSCFETWNLEINGEISSVEKKMNTRPEFHRNEDYLLKTLS